MIFGLSRGLDGMIYGGTNPGAHLLQIDPAIGNITDLGRMS